MRSLLLSGLFLVYLGSLGYSAEATVSPLALAVPDQHLDSAVPEGCIRMSELTSIVFQQSMTQNRRRSSNVPTLQCIGNCPVDAPTLTQVHCTKQGSDDYGRPTWRCVPQFGNAEGISGQQYGLGTIRVECEGCEKKGDSNVVQGSCSLKYSITVGGHSKSHGHGKRPRGHYGDPYHKHDNDVVAGLIWFIFGITTIAATVAICRSCKTNRCSTNAKYEGYTDGQGNVYGAPIYSNGGGAVHHHYGGGGGGFGTGMLTGLVVGDMISRSHHPYSYGGYGYGYEGAAAEYAGGFNGTEGGFDSAGWGGTDSI